MPKTTTAAGKDAEVLREMLTWAAEHGFPVEALTVGSVGITLRSMPGQFVPSAQSARETLYEAMGGKSLAKLVGDEGDGPYEPAIKGT